MLIAKRLADICIIALIIFAVYLTLTRTSIIVPIPPLGPTQEEHLFVLVGTLTQVMVGAIASIFGILVAVYLLSSQLVGKQPYSRFVRAFYEKTDLVYFSLLFLALIIPVANLAFWDFLITKQLYSLIDISVIIYAMSIASLLAIMIKHFGIFDAKQVVRVVLRNFNTRNVIAYGLVYVANNNYDSTLKYNLKTWGHRHNLLDPLGSYHDILMEAVSTKERITFHLYLSVLIEKVATLCGVHFERRFGLAGGRQPYARLRKLQTSIPVLSYAWRLEDRIQIVIHALHYLVRRAQKITNEWGIDNHRQIFVINLSDLVMALSERMSNALLIEICLYALLRICLDFRTIQIYGSYEPLKDLFGIAVDLQKKGFIRESNICFQVLAFLDINTPYLTDNPNVNMLEILAELPPELVNYYKEQHEQLKNQQLIDAFPNIIWTW